MARKAASKTANLRTAIICGGARTIWRDLANAGELFRPTAIFCVNDIGVDYPERIDYWCTLHPEKLRAWQDARSLAGRNTDYIAYAHEPNPELGSPDGRPRIDKWLDYRYPAMTGSGSSGLFAVKVAQAEGFDRIVLCGIPMQTVGKHYFDQKLWADCDGFKSAWVSSLEHFKDNVRSMSGWTRDLLGAPTLSWLAGDEPSSNSGAA